MLNTSTPSLGRDWFLQVDSVSLQIHFYRPRKEKQDRADLDPDAAICECLCNFITALDKLSERPSQRTAQISNSKRTKRIRDGSQTCSSTVVYLVGHVRELLNPRQEKNCKISTIDMFANLL
jgi:hypothetical protein